MIKYLSAALLKAEKTKMSSAHNVLRHGAPMYVHSCISPVSRHNYLCLPDSISAGQLPPQMPFSVPCLPG